MIGIYKITNLINGKSYIGQSIDIKRRWSEHKRSGQEEYAYKNERDYNMPLHCSMRKYGVQNFKIEVLKECPKENLDQLEKYYIKKYKSLITQNGYNISEGGQDMVGAKGEYHSQAKLTQKEVDDIYFLLQNGKSVQEISEKYNFVSKSTISMINQGKIWKKENFIYPISDQSKFVKESYYKNKNIVMNEDLVLEIRQYYVDHSFSEVVEKYKKYSYSLIKSVVYGESWKQVPIYKKRTKT